MFHRIKISARLFGGISVGLILFVVNIIIGITNTNDIYEKFNFMIEDRYNKIEIINNINNQINVISESFIEIFLHKDQQKIKFILNNAQEMRNLIEKEQKNLGKILRTDRGKELFTNLLSSYNKYLSFENKFLKEIQANHFDDMNEFLFHDLKEYRLQYQIQLSKLTEFQRTRIKEITTEIEETKKQNMFLVLSMSLIASIIMVSISLWIILSINRPVTKIAMFVERASRGDISEPMLETWDGEFDDIRKNINTMSEAIRALLAIDKYSAVFFANTVSNSKESTTDVVFKVKSTQQVAQADAAR